MLEPMINDTKNSGHQGIKGIQGTAYFDHRP